MPGCVAFGCHNRAPKKGITFHRIPKAEAIRKLWINAIRRDKWIPNKGSRICSDHFRPEDFDRTSLSTTRIRENAVPSVFPAFPRYLQKAVIKKRRVLKRLDVQAHASLPEIEANLPKKTIAQTAVFNLQLPKAVVQDTSECERESSPGNVSHASRPELVADSLRKMVAQLKRTVAELKKENAIYEKKCKVLQQSERRLNKRNLKLSSVIAELKQKKLAADDGLDILKGVSGVHEELSRQSHE